MPRAAIDPLPGRAADLRSLEQALGAAATGTPRVVTVQGEPGMGKTALLDAFVTGQTPDWGLVRVTCDRFEQEVAFGLAGMLLGEWPDATAAPVEVGRRLLTWLGDLQRATSVGVLIIDDVQWMDMPSIDALRFALRRLRADRVLTVLARRPVEGTDQWSSLTAHTGLTTVRRLQPLTAGEIVALAESDRSWQLDPTTAEWLARQTGGVPLLLRASLGDPSITAPSDLVGGLPVSSSAAAAVHRMLQSTDPPAMRLVEALAVLAEPTALVTLGAVAQVDDPTAALSAALATSVLTVDARRDTIQFAHALLRDAVYDRLTPRLRRDLHQRAAEWTTGDRCLTHRVAASDRPDPQLAATLVAVAEEEVRNDQFAVAATHLLQARVVSPDAATRDQLLLKALHHRVLARNLEGAEQLRVAAEGCPPSGWRSLALGLLRRETGQVNRAEALLVEAIAAAEAAGDDDLAARAAGELASMFATLNRGQEAVSTASRAMRSSDPTIAQPAVLVHSIGLWQRGDLRQALAELDGWRASAADSSLEADQLATRGMIRYYAGDLAGAMDDLDGAIRLAQTWRPSVMLDRAYVQRSLVHYTLGDWDASAIDAANARALAASNDQPWIAPLAHAVSIHVPAGRGQWELAEHHLNEAREAHRRIPSAQAAGLIAAAACLLHTARGDFESVLQALVPIGSGEIFDRLAAVRSHRWLMIGLIEAQTRLGRLDEAAATLDRYELLLRRLPEGPGPSRTGWLRGLLAEARSDPRAAQLGYAEDLVDPQTLAAPLAKGVVLVSSGRLERALGSRREAIEQLRAARGIFLRLRAVPYLERCDAELAACGLQPTEQDALALTPREQDVAALVVRGLTNAEAAAELFLTPKTVEYHLGNIYAKLGLSSRRDLRRLLAV